MRGREANKSKTHTLLLCALRHVTPSATAAAAATAAVFVASEHDQAAVTLVNVLEAEKQEWAHRSLKVD